MNSVIFSFVVVISGVGGLKGTSYYFHPCKYVFVDNMKTFGPLWTKKNLHTHTLMMIRIYLHECCSLKLHKKLLGKKRKKKER